MRVPSVTPGDFAALQGQLAAHRLVMAAFLAGVVRAMPGDQTEAIRRVFEGAKAGVAAADAQYAAPVGLEGLAGELTAAIHAELHRLMGETLRAL